MTPSIEPFSFQLQPVDFAVIGGYLLVLIATGIIFRRLVTTTRDYFIGGNRVSWLFAAMSAFMMSFSAWTFTGASGLAYENGFLAVCFFMGNAAAFIFNYFFIAKKIRQTRAVTAVDIIRERFGRITEQVVTWIQVPMNVMGGTIWLTGLSIFLSIGFGIPMQTSIIVAGIVIIVYSTIGGSWAVVSTDLFQSILLLLMVGTISILTMVAIGGPVGFYHKVDPQAFAMFDERRTPLWLMGATVISFFAFTSVMGAPRYLSVRDGNEARKVALLTGILFFLGPAIWFLPPIAATYFFPEISSTLPGLNHPVEGSYLVMGLSLLPHGLAGLLLMNIFGATLSTMDTAMNQSSGIITMNFYKSVFRPNASDRELFTVAHILNITFGIIVINLALMLAGSKDHGLFDVNLYLQGILTVPLAVPLFLIYFIRDTPWWSAPLSMFAGVCSGLLAHKNVLFPSLWPEFEPIINDWAGRDLLATEGAWTIGISAPLTVAVSMSIFFLSRSFSKKRSEAEKKRVERFYKKMHTPINVDVETPAGVDARQFIISGFMMMIVGPGLFLTSLSAQVTGAAKITPMCLGTIVFIIGFFMTRRGYREKKIKDGNKPIHNPENRTFEESAENSSPRVSP